MRSFFFWLLGLFFYLSQTWALPAFPGAEGFGAKTVGGRGGIVYKVTNLNEGGAGSLRRGCQLSGPRIIVFEVSGVIQVTTPINIKYSNITIAGETAPGGGITIAGIGANKNGGIASRGRDQAIIRFLRVRGAENGARGDCLSIFNCNYWIVDHCSFSWSCDETISINKSQYVTFQWNNASEGNYHNLGMLIRYGLCGYITLHHNMLAKHSTRYPFTDANYLDVRNNVNYNWEDMPGLLLLGAQYSDWSAPKYVNIVGGYWKSGGSTHATCKPIGTDGDYMHHISGNVWDKSDTFSTSVQNDLVVTPSWNALSSDFDNTAPVTTHTANEAYNLVLNSAGCCPRDSVDKRINQEVRDRTGTYHRKDTDLAAGLDFSVAAPTDRDNDGMPDWFEDSLGFDKNTEDHNGDHDLDGYTNIEEYLHYCAALKLGRLPVLTEEFTD